MRCLKPTLWLLLAFLIAGCSKFEDPKRMKSGESLYRYYCMECHVQSGIGASYENLASEKKSLKSYEIVLMIKYGYGMGHNMPTFTQLTDEQAEAVADFAIALQQGKAKINTLQQ